MLNISLKQRYKLFSAMVVQRLLTEVLFRFKLK